MTTAPTEQSQTPRRLDSLTGLRFVAAFAIFGFHMTPAITQTSLVASWQGATAGVAFFFMLSGFVMTWSSRPGDSHGSFYRRRFARIVPAYWAAWVIAIGAGLLVHRSLPLASVLTLTFLQSWIPSSAVNYATNPAFWSLSTELVFYAVFPFVLRLLRPKPSRTLVLVIIGAIALPIGLGLAFASQGRSENEIAFWLQYVFPPLQLPTFAIGVCLALLMKRGISVRVPLSIPIALSLLAVWAGGLAPDSLARIALAIVPLTLLLWAAATADVSRTRTLFASPPLTRLGDWSYCFYLTHVLVIEAFRIVFLHSGGSWGALDVVSKWSLFLLVGVIAQGVALALHYAVERPLEKRLRGAWTWTRPTWAHRRRPVGASTRGATTSARAE